MKLPEMIMALALSASLAAGCPLAQESREGAAAPAAGVQGVWEFKARAGERTLDFTLELRQEGGTLIGTLTDPEGRSLSISNASLSGNALKFTVALGPGTFQVEGALECERLAGAYTSPLGGKDTWEAKRRGAVAAKPAGNPLTSAADVEIGRKYFLGHCAHCHGPDGEGGRGANLTTGQYRHGGADRDLFRVIQNGLPGSEMPGSELSENEIWRIVAHLRRLAAAGAEEKAAGDPAAGRLVYQTKGGCTQCHVVDREGGVLGPELSDVGLRRPLKFLRQALLEPDAYVADSYRTVTVTTLRGEQINGVRLNEDEYSIQLRDTRENLRSFLKRNLKDWKREDRSLMPAYGGMLSPAEIANLVAYLSSLRRKQP